MYNRSKLANIKCKRKGKTMQDLINILNTSTITLKLPSNLWESFDTSLRKTVSANNWHTFRYLTDDDNLSPQIMNISNIKGGIYIFYASPEIIPARQRILFYVGRALLTKNQNLRKRITEYYMYYKNNDWERPKINEMFEHWGPYLYCSYIELDDNTLIEQLEAELINKLLPPFNASIPNKKISKAVRALL